MTKTNQGNRNNTVTLLPNTIGKAQIVASSTKSTSKKYKANQQYHSTASPTKSKNYRP
jgi:hypothetical protein